MTFCLRPFFKIFKKIQNFSKGISHITSKFYAGIGVLWGSFIWLWPSFICDDMFLDTNKLWITLTTTFQPHPCPSSLWFTPTPTPAPCSANDHAAIHRHYVASTSMEWTCPSRTRVSTRFPKAVGWGFRLDLPPPTGVTSHHQDSYIWVGGTSPEVLDIPPTSPFRVGILVKLHGENRSRLKAIGYRKGW